jgi:hypothetical protein
MGGKKKLSRFPHWNSERNRQFATNIQFREYVNTLMLQDILAEERWAAMLGPADRRGLPPLFWQHVRPYGEVRLDMGARLRIGGADWTATDGAESAVGCPRGGRPREAG